MKRLRAKISEYISKLKRQKTLGFFAILAAIFATGWFANSFYHQAKSPDRKVVEIRENSPDYHYINPLLIIDNSGLIFPEYKPLKSLVNDYVSKIKDQNTSVSMYFRDMNTGKWTGINENEPYAPSSMLKVPILIAYLKEASENPDILSEKIYYSQKDSASQYYKPQPLKEGYQTIRDLLKNMIIESDNDAMYLLSARNQNGISNFYKELEIPDPFSSENDNFMSAKQYASIFRTLYSSTFLPRVYSEEALRLLTFVKFDKGITAGTPSTVAVAHKFGERTVIENNKVKERQLHDCGIIYYPNKPYLLCVMTKGQDFSSLEKIISDISNIVYTHIDSF